MHLDALRATGLEGAVVDLVLVGLKLDGGMDSASKSMIGMLVHDQDDIIFRLFDLHYD